MKKILFVNHVNERCGVYQYGFDFYTTISKITNWQFDYAKVDSREKLADKILVSNPDYIIYNAHPSTLSFVDQSFLNRYRSIIHISLLHLFDPKRAAEVFDEGFNYYLMGDPTLKLEDPRLFKIGRIIPQYENRFEIPKIPTIGSFGLGSRSKGFEFLIDQVRREFSEAIIRIQTPKDSFIDPKNIWLNRFIDLESKKLKGTGINLEISTDLLSQNALLDFLAQNSINVFPYPESNRQTDSTGISSSVDKAIAVKRPIAVTTNALFRHLHGLHPSILMNGPKKTLSLFSSPFQNKIRTIKEIMADGAESVSLLRDLYSEKKFIQQFEKILDQIQSQEKNVILERRKFNRILDDSARKELDPIISELKALSPDMFKRKIPRANVQQAFIFDAVRRFAKPSDKILCVGSHEDTASDSLKQLGYSITEIDPAINWDLETFFNLPSTFRESYDLIFSTSVLEHVEHDEQFIQLLIELLKPKGKAFLTFDYKEEYKKGDKIFDCNYRFYNLKDLYSRILPLLEECTLLDEANWFPAQQDFKFCGIQYCFGTLSFQKNGSSNLFNRNKI